MSDAGDNNTKVKVMLGGEVILNEIAPGKVTGGYYGFHSPNVGITVYNKG